MEDIKQTLYAVLGKRKLGAPNYSINLENRGGRQRFQCNLSVPGINYVGFGNSTSKKDAQSNAARDFGQYLVREGMINASELPQLQIQDIQGQQHQPGFPNIGSEPPVNFHPPPPFQGQQQNEFANDPGVSQLEHPEPTPSGSGGFSVPTYRRPNKTLHDQYIEQKAEQISQSEAVDMTAEIHGGWTMENCKQALNEFCQKNRRPINEYKMTCTETNGNNTFVAENSIFLPDGRTIFGHGQASTKKVAQTSCALSLVRQLFHMSILPAANVPLKKKSSPTDLAPIKVNVDPGLSARIEEFLATSGVQPVDEGLTDASADQPRSLLVDQKLMDFPPSESTSYGGPIVWAPPLQNWSAWKNANIDNQPIAFWPLERIGTDLMHREKAKEIPAKIADFRKSLPVFQHRDEIVQMVVENPVVLIKGSTGCGKSTQICQYLMESHIMNNMGANFNCYVTQPRRISAITLAERVAEERCEQLGDSVGYSVRFEGVTPRPYGAVMFLTVGVLMRKMEFGLRGISHLIIDEIHERDINTDFLLIVIRDMVRAYPKLRVLLMSATIDTTLFTDYFGACPIIEIEQRVHPVQAYYLEDVINMLQFMPPVPEPERKKKKKKKTDSAADGDPMGAGGGGEGANDEESIAISESMLVCADNYHPQVKMALNRMNEREIPIELMEMLLADIDANGKPGAVLIFLPGWNMISMMWNHLILHPVFSNTRRFIILPLHSQLSAREQHKVFEPVGNDQRKIILSTNIAETSVTIDDVVYVIDSCRAREKMYTSRNNLVHFANVWASRTNLIQRRGRAGRVQEGFCFHMITKARFNALEEHRTPEMLRTPLHEITLTIKLLRLGSAGEFLKKAVQAPPLDAIVEAEVLLRDMNALDKDLELTELGRILARLPIEPKLGKTLVLGTALGVGDLMLTAAAATSFNTPFVPRERVHTKLCHMHRSFSGNRFSDHVGLVNVNEQFETEIEMDGADNFCRRYSLSYPLLSMTCEAKRQIRDVMVNICGFPEHLFSPYHVDVHRQDPGIDIFLSMLVAAYYPNICYMRDRRRVYTLEQATALLSNMSVCVPFLKGGTIEFPSPLFVFSEKLRTSCISCKQVSMISPLQLLLFGCRKVEAIGANSVRLDSMIPLEVPAKIAAQIVALRPCIEALTIRACLHPEQIKISDQDMKLADIVRELSSDFGWLPTGEQGLEPQQNNGQVPPTSSHPPPAAAALMKMSPGIRYNAAQQDEYASPQQRYPPIANGVLRKRPWGQPPPLPPPPEQGGYGSQPVPLDGTNANGGPGSEDYSSMAGYGYGNYFGSTDPQRYQPQFSPVQRGRGGGRFPRRNAGGPMGRGGRGGRGRGGRWS